MPGERSSMITADSRCKHAIVFCLLCVLAVPANLQAIDRRQAHFKRLLVGRNDNVRVSAIRSVSTDFQTRLAALPVVIESLDKLSESAQFSGDPKPGQPELPDGTKLMIDFVGSIDRPEATEALVRQLDCGRVSWMMATAQTLGKNQHHASIDDLASLIGSEAFESNYGFRFTLARALKEMKHPDAWDALAKLMERVDGQLAFRLDQEFQTVTVEDFADDQQRFQAWRGMVGLAAQQDQEQQAGSPLARAAALLNNPKAAEMPLPEKMSLGPEKSAASYARQRRLVPSQYYGIKIYAKRLLFVIDRSGSMSTMVSNGQSRLLNAKRELITAIDGLDPQCEFGILVFDTDVRHWKEELVEADEENKLDAIRFVEYLGAGNKTNTYGALRRSLEFDEQLESVFLLTDGQPTTGLIINPQTILLDILRRNETNNVTINAIAIGVEPSTSVFLRNLTEPSNGEFKEVK